MTFESDITMEEWAEATQSLKGRLLRNALWHVRALEPRPITVLQKNGLLEAVQFLEPSQYDAQVLSNPDHPARIAIPAGPMLVYHKEGDESDAVLWHVEDLLFSPDFGVRDAAARHFELMAAADSQLLTSRTRATIHRCACELRSDDPGCWRPAAIDIGDSIRDDFLCNLAGARQSVVLRKNDGRYTPRVLHPAKLALDKTDVHVWKPSSQQAEMEDRIRGYAKECPTLREACVHYYREFGYVPLAEPLSMVRLLDEWLAVHGGHDQVWEEVWAWADEVYSPLPRYHVCLIFVRRPKLIPDGKLDDLWQEIVQVVHLPSADGTDLKWSRAWQIRCDLARHYAWHLQSHFPGQDGELIAGLSWWFAEQVSAVFGANPKVIEHVIRTTVTPVAERSSFVWQLACAPISTSGFRYTTFFTTSVWSLSLLSAMDQLLDGCVPMPDAQAHTSAIDAAMALAATQTFPMVPAEHGESSYVFERGLLSSAEAWLRATADSDQPGLLHFLVSATPKAAAADWLSKALEDLPRMDAGNQTLVASVLRMMAFTGTIPTETIWDFLSNSEWAKDTLLKLDLNAIDPFFQALTEIQVQCGQRWLAQVPHFFAYGAELACNDRDRQRIFFAFTTISSAIGGSTSAIRRLLRGTQKRKFAKDKDYWRRQLESIRPELSPWVAGRVRSLMASLHIH